MSEPLRDRVRAFRPGERVVLRYLLPDGCATDALGTLTATDRDRLVVQTRRGPVAVPVAAVVAARRVPPAPSRRGPARPA